MRKLFALLAVAAVCYAAGRAKKATYEFFVCYRVYFHNGATAIRSDSYVATLVGKIHDGYSLSSKRGVTRLCRKFDMKHCVEETTALIEIIDQTKTKIDGGAGD